jgi:RNA ligase (TIGR02306 family)
MVKLLKKTKLENKYFKYDIETVPYHNFVANGIFVHNSSSRYLWNNGEMFVGSRTCWKAPDSKNIWWISYNDCPQIKTFCYDNQDCVLYGEVYGKVQDLNYGVKSGAKFIAFDILKKGQWLDATEFAKICDQYLIPRVPILYTGPFSFQIVEKYAEGNSVMFGADHIREGCVVRPLIERTHPKIGRVCLKLVGNGYLMGKN